MEKDLTYETVKSPWGSFVITASEKGLYSLDFPSPRKKARRPKTSQKKNSDLRKAKKLLEAYFSGKKADLSSIRVDLSGYGPFEKKVYANLKKVPSGKVLSYRELATKAGSPKAYRAVGSTMRKNRLPVVLPCHRVLGSNGNLCGFSAGLHWKKRLLTLEKAKFF